MTWSPTGAGRPDIRSRGTGRDPCRSTDRRGQPWGRAARADQCRLCPGQTRHRWHGLDLSSTVWCRLHYRNPDQPLRSGGQFRPVDEPCGTRPHASDDRGARQGGSRSRDLGIGQAATRIDVRRRRRRRDRICARTLFGRRTDQHRHRDRRLDSRTGRIDGAGRGLLRQPHL